MKTSYSPKPLLLAIIILSAFMACTDKSKEDSSDDTELLSKKARDEQQKKIYEDAARLTREKELREEQLRLTRAADSVQSELELHLSRASADSIAAAERERMAAIEREREERLREEAYQRELERLEGQVPKPITGLFLLYGEGAPPRGYTKIARDLNKDAGGDFIYLCYTKDPSMGKPITGIKVAINDERQRHIPRNYEPLTCNRQGQNGLCDVNKEAGGKYVFMFMSRKKIEGDPITEVDITFGDQVKRQDWTLLDNDLNAGAGGAFIWLNYSRK